MQFWQSTSSREANTYVTAKRICWKASTLAEAHVLHSRGLRSSWEVPPYGMAILRLPPGVNSVVGYKVDSFCHPISLSSKPF